VAFRIVPAESGLPRILCYEAVLTGAKLRRYFWLWWLIDTVENPNGVLELYLVDRAGRESTISLASLYEEEVERTVAASRRPA
jgi:hypothetical protein